MQEIVANCLVWIRDKDDVEYIILIKEPKHRSLSMGEGDGR